MKSLEVKYTVPTQDIKEDPGLGMLQTSLLFHPGSLWPPIEETSQSLGNIRGVFELWVVCFQAILAFVPRAPHECHCKEVTYSPAVPRVKFLCLWDGPWFWFSGKTVTQLAALEFFFPVGSLLLELDPWCGVLATLCMCFLHAYPSIMISLATWTEPRTHLPCLFWPATYPCLLLLMLP